MNILNNKKLCAHLSLYLATSIWGSSFIFTKVILLADVPPITTAGLRFFFSFILLYIYIAITKKTSLRVSFRELLNYAILGFLGVTIFYWSENVSLLYISTASSSLIRALVPALTLIMSFFVFGEKVTFTKLAGLIIAFIGSMVIILDSANFNSLININVGYLYSFLATVTFALYSILTKVLTNNKNPLKVIFYGFVFGTLFLIPLGISEYSKLYSITITLNLILGFLYLIVFCSILSFFFWSWGLKFIDAGIASTYMNNVPLVTMVLGTLFLGEYLSGYLIIGGIFILSGIYLSSIKSKESERAPC
ncbi:EamA family transporter [Affinibrenneria salicis]|uniref:Threonine/homoserine exporter RhtA n=1 Tax=Affinibrenneria salicis TaxID=2590031 RepID=A0A5J5FZ64_9GAMM|nr:EamA family transporter [Affinibrenneria salicis]KAA8999471.1 EamA family transporter [Affinibrenneria salicis]